MSSSSYDQFFKKVRQANRNQEMRQPTSRDRLAKSSSTRDRVASTERAAPRDRVGVAKGSSSRTPVGGPDSNRSGPRQNLGKRKKRSLPLSFITFVPFLLGVAYWCDFNPEKMMDLWNRIELKAMTVAGANEDGPSAHGDEGSKKQDGKKSEGKNSHDKTSEKEKIAATSGSEKKENENHEKGWTEEEIALFKNLESRKKTLDAREAELNKLEEELQKQRKELEDRLKQLEATRQKIATQLEERVQSDQEKVDKLVALYSNMKPQSAAKVLQDLNEDLVVDILGKMKQKSAAEIMNLLQPDKAQKLSEKFAGYKRR